MRRLAMMVAVPLAVSAAGAGQPAQSVPARLGDVLASAGIPGDGLPASDLSSVLTDFAVEQRPEQSSLVYHLAPPGERRALHVRMRDARGAWRAAEVEANPAGDGEITQVRHLGSRLVVEAQAGPYRGRVLLFDQGLALERRLDGVLLAVLPDATMVLRENVETAAHPLAVALFSPARGDTSRIYPLPPWSAARSQFIERAKRAYATWGLRNCIAANHPCNAEQFDASVVSDVRVDAFGTRLAWVTRYDAAADGAAPPVGERQHVLVVCTRTGGALAATCRERAFRHYDGPEGHNTESALALAISHRTRF